MPLMRLFRRAGNKAVIDRLYTAVVAASRQPALFDRLGIPDTFEGRFESLAVHTVLVVRRLRSGAEPGPEMAQDLVDTVFQHFDRALREMGVGDTTVPKRMKSLAEAYLGRSAAYGAALDGTPPSGAPPSDHASRIGAAEGVASSGDLADALARNVYNGRSDAAALARYVEASAAALEGAPLQHFMDGIVPFADPGSAAERTS